MNMKRLIDQANFDNVEQISKRWKKQSHNQSQIKQSISDIAQILNSTQNFKENQKTLNQPQPQKDYSVEYTNKQVRKRNVIPQIIDQDTQHFKNRLQNLLNVFKTDAISEFIGMKKSILDNQKQTIKQDTQKYLTMYQQKHQQLLQTKQKLIQITKQAQKKTIQCQLMSNHIAKLNQKIKITKYLSRPFALLYQNKQKEKMIKFKYSEASKSDNKRMKNKCFIGWRNICKDIKKQKEKENIENQINTEVNDIVGRFQKQMEVLREQLHQAQRKNQQYQNNKHLIQENLKKAFLRGMCAMNMEAMGVLGENDITNTSQMNMSQLNQTNTNYQQNTNRNLNVTNNNILGKSLVNMTSQKSLRNSVTPNNNPSVIIGKVKTQSKEHKWKQAPIMGVQANQEAQEPRPILVKPSTQGKVIKVIDGKSSMMENKQKNIAKTVTKQQNNNINKSSTLISSRKNI